MSLVVVQIVDNRPLIVSDTRVAFPDGPRSSFKTGTLKAIIIARDVTICFAGDVSAGLDAVRHFAAEIEAGGPVEGLIPHLQETASNERRVVEFIVAIGGDVPELIRIAGGRGERGLQVAWIGDQNAFEMFQRERHRPSRWPPEFESRLPPATRGMGQLRDAMRAVIDEPTVDSVGDFCVAVSYRRAGFEYLGSMFIHVGRDFPLEPGRDLIGAMVRPVEEGGYAVSVVEPAEPGTPALGLSFPRAKLGMLYLPLRFDGAQVISDVSPNDFAKVVLERFNGAMKDPPLRHP